ncbi:MAG: alpha/beta hydrolase [Eubacteriaceae bacterium]|nr:alpha/beta hydrolase [Eubacteriaceae bacterium]
MEKSTIEGYNATVHTPKSPSRRALYIIGSDASDMYEGICNEYGVLTVCLEVEDWNRDLSPRKAPRAFKGQEDFSGGAGKFAQILTERIIPTIEEEVSAVKVGMTASTVVTKRYIAGYSLAGLFACYACLSTECFDGFASVSGSLWFDGFIDDVKNSAKRPPVQRAYFSLGDREKNTRNQRMAVVEDMTREISALFEERGAETLFELNPGNHFADSELRMKKGIDFLLGV